MRFTRTKSIGVAVALVASATFVLSLASAPAFASGTVWVSPTPTVVGGPSAGTSCAHPGSNTIQHGINLALQLGAASVNVCSGTYTEQLAIVRSVKLVAKGAVTLQLPASPVTSTLACDTAPGSGPNPQDAIDICGTGAPSPITVSITGITVHANWPEGTCNDDLYGIFAGGGATVKLSSVAITAAGAVPLNGCQGGIGIQIGTSPDWSNQTAFAKMSNVSVSGYQKNGIDIEGTGSTGTISNSTVTGIGPTDQIAQNGIQISTGAQGKVSSSNVSGNECDVAACGPDSLTQTQSAGILFFDQVAGSSVTNSTISGNDMGVYSATYSGSAPTHAMATISGNHFVDNRYAGVMIDQGFTAVNNNTITTTTAGSVPAIQLIQYDGQTFGVNGTGSRDTITNTSVAVQVHSDQSVNDVAGKFKITNSSFGGGGVFNENPTKFTVNQSNNT